MAGLFHFAERPLSPATAVRLKSVRSATRSAPSGRSYGSATPPHRIKFAINRETPSDERIARAIWSVEENYARRAKLDDMARIAGLSHRHLVGVSRRLTGTTLHAYVTERLKIRAMELLSEKRLNVKQVAEALGLSSIYVFSRWFHRAVGLAPTRFMKDGKQGSTRRQRT